MRSAVHSLREIPSGDPGVDVTLREMRSIVRRWAMHPDIRALAIQVTDGCGERDIVCWCKRLQEFVRRHIRYVPDVAEVETLQTPDVTLEQRVGDCDDQCILLASLLRSIGVSVRFVAIDTTGDGFSHVLCEVMIGGYWRSCETTENWPLGHRVQGVQRHLIRKV